MNVVKISKFKLALYRISAIILFSLLGLAFVFSIILFAVDSENLSIKYQGLDKSQTIIVSHIIENIDPIYLQKVKQIIFTTNYTDIPDNRNLNLSIYEEKMKVEAGIFYRIPKIIYVLYSRNETVLKNRLCHELLHSFVMPGHEDIVSNLASYEVCYIKEPKSPLIIDYFI